MWGFKLLWTFSCFISAVSGSVLFSVFTSKVGVPVGIGTSAVGLKIFSIIEEIISKV